MVAFPNVKPGNVFIDAVSVPRKRLVVRVISVDYAMSTAIVTINEGPIAKPKLAPVTPIRAGTHASGRGGTHGGRR